MRDRATPASALRPTTFAGIVCALEQNLEAALSHLNEAIELNPELSEAHYQRASLSAFAGHEQAALVIARGCHQRESPILRPAFAETAALIVFVKKSRSLLEKLIQPIRERVAEVKRNARSLDAYFIAPSIADRIFLSLKTLKST
jgi:hypothetical protein